MTVLHIWELPEGTKVLLKNNSTYVNVKNIPRDVDESLIEKVKSRFGIPISVSFPVNFLTQEWAALVGTVLGDGLINTGGGVGYWNKDRDFFEKFNLLLKKMKLAFTVDEKNFSIRMPEILADILIQGLGLTRGDKVKNNIGIPRIFLDCEDEQVIGSLLRWLFTCDGWVTIFKDHLGQAHRNVGIGFGTSIKDSQPQLLIGTIFLLDKIGITTSKRVFETKISKNKLSFFCKVFIRGRNNLIKFRDKVGFISERKSNILDTAINSFERPKLGDGESLDLVLKSIEETSLEYGFATKHNIEELTRLRVKWIERIITRLIREERIKVIGGGNRSPTGYGKLPFRLQVIGNQSIFGSSR
ncbi:MAG: LAGLIDADG family homing endonuclease [Candidatus Aenigmarchaeota archaeon]|nr:LAGLIDADG family homing endonuclease [Candidatus Aenigmarchaeota archaeon]